jgi:excinuclease ABC subunit B
MGRAARNQNGKVVMYADKMTDSMKRAIDETNRRREKQMKYNEEHGIDPKTVYKSKAEIIKQTSVLDIRAKAEDYYVEPEANSLVADPVVQYMDKAQLEKAIEDTKKKMHRAAKQTDFMEAARLRDEMFALQEMLKEKTDS